MPPRRFYPSAVDEQDAALPLYRLLISIFALFALAGALRRGGPRLVAARLGAGRPARQGPHIWLHGASNGELASARPVIRALRASRPDLDVLVTCNSATGVAMVDRWALPGVTARPAPVDLAWVTRRMMRRWRVVAHLALEAELWPHRVLGCPGPVVLLGARMRPGTARLWRRFGALGRRVLGRVALASAQDEGTRDRLRDLGLPGVAEAPLLDLKALYRPPEIAPEPTLSDALPRSETWLAASTHAGEEEIVLEAHRALLEAAPKSRLILAPRHPRRGDEVATLIAAQGLTMARRSTGGNPAGAQVYLADTMGEMALWYALAGRVFVGGTLTDRGGHTPYEPAAFGAALLHGPDVANFRAPFARLDKAGAARKIRSAEELSQALRDLSDPQAQASAGATAARALRQEGDLDALIDRIAALLPEPSRT